MSDTRQDLICDDYSTLDRVYKKQDIELIFPTKEINLVYTNYPHKVPVLRKKRFIANSNVLNLLSYSSKAKIR